jgi:hypothetical protein
MVQRFPVTGAQKGPFVYSQEPTTPGKDDFAQV